MKILTTAVLFSVSLIALGAHAQLEGAVSFDKNTIPAPVAAKTVTSVTAPVTPERKTRPTIDKQQRLKDQLAKDKNFNDPVFAKQFYGAMQGTQQAIEAEQKAALEERTFATAEEKAAFEKQMQEDALIQFKDFDDDSQTVNKKINENPRQKIEEMANRTTFADPKKITKEDSETMRDEANMAFEARQGVSTDEYMQIYQEQMAEKAAQAVPAEDLNERVFLVDENKVDVQKIDEQNAVIQKPKKK